MPTYSYRCAECGEAFDIVQSFSDASLTICPACGGRLRKIYGAVGVTFNGSGFYRNDSRPASASKSDGGSGSGSTSSATSESKPSSGSSAPASSSSSD